MLSKVKKGEKGKKDPKKQKKENKQTTKKQPTTDLNLGDQDETFDLVDIDYSQKQQKNKAKAAPKKKNKSNLDEEEIVHEKLLEKKVEEKAPRTTWVTNTVDEALGKKFDMKDHNTAFESLTDQNLNEKLKQEQQLKKKQEKKNPEPFIEGGIKLAPLEKSADQLAMEKADGGIVLGANKNPTTISQIPFSNNNSGPKNFVNSNLGNMNVVQIEKTPQQLRMEEAERKQQQLALKKKPDTWLGSRKDTDQQQQKPKVNPWAMGGTQKTEQKKPAVNAWVSKAQEDPNTGLKFAPLQHSTQQAKLANLQRKQQDFVFVSKKELEQRKKKREEKQKLEQQRIVS